MAINQKNRSQARSKLANPSSASIMALALALSASASVAATADAGSAKPTDNTVDQVIVTGSRVQTTGFTSPTPVTVVDSKRIQALGLTDLGTALAQMPSFKATTSPTYTPLVFAPGQRLADLRGLNPVRTLVLFDNRRVVPTTSLGTVDLNILPLELMQRADIVTGGASAAYGADAVAGVINLVMNTKFTGFKGQVQYGQTQRDDAKNYNLSMAGGQDILGGRGHIVGSFEFNKDQGTGDCYSRQWCRNESSIVSNVAGAGGLPATNFIQSGTTGSTAVSGGLITSGVLRGTRFLPNGAPAQFTFGSPISSLVMVGGGDGPGFSPLAKGVPLSQPVTRYNLFGHGSFDFTDHVSGYLEGVFANVTAHNVNTLRDQGTLTLKSDNAYLPAASQAALAAAGQTSFSFGRLNEDLPSPITNHERVYQVTAGLSGDVFGDWKWDGYYQFAHSRQEQITQNSRVAANFAQAIDAVKAPAGNTAGVAAGTVVCRSTLTAPTNGCVPFDLFGLNQFTSAAQAYSFATADAVVVVKQQVLAGNLHGTLLNLPAGPLAVATGFEFRRDETQGTSDPLSQTLAFATGNPQAFSGRINVKEAYAEGVAPILKDQPFAKSLELNGALRETDYSTSGRATTWKVGGTYEPVDFLRFRATRSRDIRAPNTAELFGATVSSRTTITDPRFGGLQTSILAFVGSNPDLKPEIADTKTGGVVFSPHWGWSDGLRLSVDYYDIHIRNAIARLGSANIATRCFQGAADLCALITRDPVSGQIISVKDQYQNTSAFIARGLDTELDYRFPLSRISDGLPGSLELHAVASHVYDLITVDSAGAVDRAGEVAPSSAIPAAAPKFTLDSDLTYANGPFSVTTQAHFVAAGKYRTINLAPGDPGYSIFLINSTNNNKIEPRIVWALAGSYKFVNTESKLIEVYGSIENLFDKDPPNAPASFGPTNPQFYDVLGRRFIMGVRISY